MIDDPRLERALPGILDTLGRGPTPDYAEAILGETVRTRQRPALAFPEGWVPARFAPASARSAGLSWRPIGALALLVLALAGLALAAVATQRPRVPAPFGPAGNGEFVYSANGDILAADPVTGLSRPLSTTNYGDYAPMYSPDGEHIMFLRDAPPFSALTQSTGATDLVIMDADGSHDRVLTERPLPEPPAWGQWAADSRSLLIITTPRADARLERIFIEPGHLPAVIETHGIQPMEVHPQPPDGRRILVRGRQGSRLGLWTMGIDGTDVATVVPPFASDDGGDLSGASWSPDGRRVVYQRAMPGEGQKLYITNADGSGGHEIAADAGGLWHVDGQWSPDSTRILFRQGLSDDPWRYRWMVVTPADGHVQATGPELDLWSQAVWSPDGSQVIVVVSDSHPTPALLLDPAGGPWREATWLADSGGDWQRLAR